MNIKAGFIGAGNMGGSILCGVTNSNILCHDDIYVHSLVLSDKVKELNINVTNLEDLVKNSDYIILCIKPNGFEELLRKIKQIPSYENKIYVSIAAGVSISYIKNILGDVSVIRTMPNLPLFAGAGMTVIAPDSTISEDEYAFCEKIFSSCGKTLRVKEEEISAYTSVSGSGPAYAFMFIEALADAAVRGGIPRDKAYLVASQTLLGSAHMQLETGMHPGVLKDMVCSPAGTTIQAVRVLEEKGMRAAVMDAMKTCLDKSRNM